MNEESMQISIQVLKQLSMNVLQFDAPSLKSLRQAVFPLLTLQKNKHFEYAPPDATSTSNQICKEHVLELITICNHLVSHPEVFNSSELKQFRRALHPLVLYKYHPHTLTAVDTSASCKISNYLHAQEFDHALAALYAMARDRSGRSDRSEAPKLGAIQRWVRACDVNTSAGKEQSKERVRLLDAVLRVMHPATHNSVYTTSHTLYTQEKPEKKSGKKRALIDTRTIDTSEAIIGEIVYAPLFIVSSVDSTPIVIHNETVAMFTSLVCVVSHIAAIDRRPPSLVDLDVFALDAKAALLSTHRTACTRHDVPYVPGAFLIQNVLSASECMQFIHAAHAMEYTPDAVDGIDNIQWLVHDAVLMPIFERCASLLPPTMQGCSLMGLNARFRLFRYFPGAVYRPHIDGAWPGSGLSPDGTFTDDIHGDRISKLTFLIYLNDDFDGGETTFFLPSSRIGCIDARGVRPVQGAVLCFPHGDVQHSLVHEGSGVLKGVKYVCRTDVLYAVSARGS